MKERQTSRVSRRKPAGGGIGRGMVRVSILAELTGLVRHLGHDPVPLLREAGVDPALLRDPDNPIAFVTAAGLIERCAARTGCARRRVSRCWCSNWSAPTSRQWSLVSTRGPARVRTS